MVFRPSAAGPRRAVLLLRSNASVLEAVRVVGEGGEGRLVFQVLCASRWESESEGFYFRLVTGGGSLSLLDGGGGGQAEWVAPGGGFYYIVGTKRQRKFFNPAIYCPNVAPHAVRIQSFRWGSPPP